jgi:hypothetical protein
VPEQPLLQLLLLLLLRWRLHVCWQEVQALADMLHRQHRQP